MQMPKLERYFTSASINNPNTNLVAHSGCKVTGRSTTQLLTCSSIYNAKFDLTQLPFFAFGPIISL